MVEKKKKYFVAQLLQWSKVNSISFPWRRSQDLYHVLVSEMLLRKTKADRVANVYPKFILKYPSFERLNAADPKEVRIVIESLGLGNMRSKWIKQITQTINQKYGNLISPGDRIDDALTKNQRYLNNALKCFAFGEDVAIFDVNVSRVLERVFSIDLGKEAHKKSVSWAIASLLIPKGFSKEYNWALLDLGRVICKARKPNCPICPLREICNFYSNQRRSRDAD